APERWPGWDTRPADEASYVPRGNIPMALNWPGEILAQADFYWDYSLRPRLQGLTDAEFYWEPVPGTWTVRQLPDGRHAPDSAPSERDPDLVITVSWHLAYMVVVVLEACNNLNFGDRTLSRDTFDWPSGGDEDR